MADLDLLAKVCYALNCKVEDILKYEEPEEPKSPPNDNERRLRWICGIL